ncbi:IclR family transcriptional regulator [Nocardia panacis]|uniref:IclR family transcriptional regulator n=1 Tax=Nocardia panacis TaxID=2340916 RepID=A0A3A4KP44_9NOCA|nr:IclR family transcriptional regulator [Nocardia panacis]RJO79222.1 IclR family transcriptional regulator [Nocardia panacis]
MARSTSGESVLCRVVRIFEAFDPETTAITVSELARRADLPPATTSRLVSELVEHGWLRRDSGRRVRVGVRMWELAVRASPTLGLREAAMPYMEDLHAVVGHHVQLSVLQHREVLYIEQLSAPGAVRNKSHFGGRFPLHASSPGLVLLAHGPIHLQEQVLAGPLRVFTARTVTDPAALRVLLGGIRREGYALCEGYIDELSTVAAAPLRAAGGQVVAALSVILPRTERARGAVPALVAAARGISRALGAPVRPPRHRVTVENPDH